MQVPIGKIQQLWGWDSDFTIDSEKHTAIVGATGSGKSTLLKSFMIPQIEAGIGICLIDPHGDLVDDVLRHIPKSRANDVIYWDASSDTGDIPLNILEGDNKQLKLQETLKVVSTIWANSWGAQSDFLFRNFGEAVIETESHPTLLHIYKAFMSKSYREKLRARVKSPNLKLFFEKVEDDWDKRQQEQAGAPPTNKVDSFMQPPLKYIIGQKQGLDFRRIIDERKILLCRFSKGKLGPEIPAFLGALVIAKILFALLERESTKERSPFSLFVDEYPNFGRGHAPAQILAEARKYGGSLTAVFQNFDQLPEGMEQAILGNVSSLLVGRVGADDADKLAGELGLPDGKTLLQLTSFYWYGKTLRNGMMSEPILFRGIELQHSKNTAKVSSILKRSRIRYEKPRSQTIKNLQTFLST